jgi:hypothetical protein
VLLRDSLRVLVQRVGKLNLRTYHEANLHLHHSHGKRVSRLALLERGDPPKPVIYERDGLAFRGTEPLP